LITVERLASEVFCEKAKTRTAFRKKRKQPFLDDYLFSKKGAPENRNAGESCPPIHPDLKTINNL